jgi:hypothetical protein
MTSASEDCIKEKILLTRDKYFVFKEEIEDAECSKSDNNDASIPGRDSLYFGAIDKNGSRA